MQGFPNTRRLLCLVSVLLGLGLAAPATADPPATVDPAAEAWLGVYCPPRASSAANLAGFAVAALLIAWRGRHVRART
jgi:hypothetical protein